MTKDRLKPGDIEVGAPILFDAYDEKGRLLLSAGQIIYSLSQLERLMEWGMYGDRNLPAASGLNASTGRQTADQSQTRFSVFDLITEIRQDLHQNLTAPDDGFARKIAILAGRVSLVCELDSDAALASLFLDRNARYSIRHSVSTAILTAVIAQHRQLDAAVADSAVAAALTMNIAVLDFLDQLYSDGGQLSETQKLHLISHPDQGAVRLLELGVKDEAWISTVRQHHEAHDGSGFPRKLAGDAIHPLASIVAAAERYCGAITERAYRPGAPPDAALDFITEKHKATVHPEVAAILRQQIGMYPPGTVVTLANGDLAIVVKRTLSAGQPVARALRNRQGGNLEGFPKRLTKKPPFAIVQVLPYEILDREFDPLVLWHDSLMPGETEPLFE